MHLALRASLFLSIAGGIFLAACSSKAGCESGGGKWASATSSCVKRDCINSSSCGEWATPKAYCSNLNLGASRGEVYFQLGMPRESTADIARWTAEKGGADEIVANFSGDALVDLKCSGSNLSAGAAK
jgi:hypothetical protein